MLPSYPLDGEVRPPGHGFPRKDEVLTLWPNHSCAHRHANVSRTAEPRPDRAVIPGSFERYAPRPAIPPEAVVCTRGPSLVENGFLHGTGSGSGVFVGGRKVNQAPPR